MAGFAPLFHRNEFATFGAAGILASFFQFCAGALNHCSVSKNRICESLSESLV